jgi:trehalose-phosphatase
VKPLVDLVPAGVRLAVLLDYDGTLVPIRRRPELATLDPERRAELGLLGRKALVGLVSGRPLSEIRRLVGIPGLAYAGNHGLEIRVSGRNWVHPGAGARTRAVARAAAAIRARTSRLPGVLVEDKGLTASVHFRLAAARRRALIRTIVAEEVLRSRGGLALTRGKMVLEVRPNVPWDKGRGVVELMRRADGSRPLFPIYIGDDRTDEDAFRALRDRGLTIRVGSGRRTLARHSLRDVKAVWAFLTALRQRLGTVPEPSIFPGPLL